MQTSEEKTTLLLSLISDPNSLAQLRRALDEVESRTTQPLTATRPPLQGNPKTEKSAGYFAPCRFYSIGCPEGCKKGNTCKYLHLDPTHPKGCMNIPEELFEARRQVITRNIRKNWPTCDFLKSQAPEQVDAPMVTLPKAESSSL
jgi:hypothetical protein